MSTLDTTNTGASERNRGRPKRPTAPKPVRQVARAADTTVRELAMAVHADQPSPSAPPEQAALMRWLTQAAANANPGVDDREVAECVVAQVEEMAEAGDETAKGLTEALVHDFATAMARTAIAMHGARWVPAAPEVPKQERQDEIASTVLRLTDWKSVDDETVQAIYRWLFGDEAAFVAAIEMRVEAGLHMLDNRDPRPVRVPHPDTGALVLVTREEIIEHAEADGRVLEAAQRYEERRARRHDRLRAALRPYGDSTTTVDEALRRAAVDLGIEAEGRGFHELANLVGGGRRSAGRPAGGQAVRDRRRYESARVTPVAGWSADELARRALLEQGAAVAFNLRRHHNLIAWARERGLFVRVDRATPWGNPFVLGRDGDRETVIAAYRDHYLPFKPSLLGRLGELRGKALGCWCAPEACHADVLAAAAG